MGATMVSAKSEKPMQFRSIFYGFWLGSIVGAILITAIRPMFFGNVPWLDVAATLRNVTIIGPTVAASSFILLPLLVRHEKLHFVGFTGAGVVVGGVTTLLYLLANRVLHWFPPATTMSMTYVFCSAVVVAWSIWLVSVVIELIDRRRGEAR